MAEAGTESSSLWCISPQTISSCSYLIHSPHASTTNQTGVPWMTMCLFTMQLKILSIAQLFLFLAGWGEGVWGGVLYSLNKQIREKNPTHFLMYIWILMLTYVDSLLGLVRKIFSSIAWVTTTWANGVTGSSRKSLFSLWVSHQKLAETPS